jgi:hypothetical protein
VVEFDRVWRSRQDVALAPGVGVQIPALDDLILTKQIAARPKDLEDIRLLRMLQREDGI